MRRIDFDTFDLGEDTRGVTVVCLACGSVVVGTTKHTKFHERIDASYWSNDYNFMVVKK